MDIFTKEVSALDDKALTSLLAETLSAYHKADNAIRGNVLWEYRNVLAKEVDARVERLSASGSLATLTEMLRS